MSPGAGLTDRILAAARAAGCREAELFIKTSSARTLALEPPLHPDLPTHVSVSRQEEVGAGLRVTDAEGRTGLAWRGGGIGLREMADVAFLDAWIREALVAAWFGRSVPGRGAPAFGREPAGNIEKVSCGGRLHLTYPCSGVRALRAASQETAMR